MYIQNPAHTAHKCTQILIFLYIKHLSIFMIVCKMCKTCFLCAKRAFVCKMCACVCSLCAKI